MEVESYLLFNCGFLPFCVVLCYFARLLSTQLVLKRLDLVF